MENDTSSLPAILVWSGAALSLLGFAGLIYCIVRVARAKRQAVSEEDMRKVLQTTLPMNLAALFLSAIGLMLVVLGIFLK